MNSTTDAPTTTRKARTADRRVDPAAIWEPLPRLAEAAAEASSAQTTVAIARGFDRNARTRAKALSESLADQGVAAVEITPAPDSEQLLAGRSVAAVVNLVGAGSWQPYRLAARNQAPVLTPQPVEGETSPAAQRDIIAVTGTDGARDVALTRVAVLPEDTEEAQITLTRDGEPLSIPGGNVAVTPDGQQLRIHLEGPDFDAQSFTATKIEIETSGGPHRFVRDESPIAEFEGAVTLSAEQGGLTVRPV